MSAAFALDFSGPPVPCDYPRCILGPFHEGEHAFAPEPQFAPERVHVCRVCGVRFVIYGETTPSERHVCDNADCLLELARREAFEVPLMCTCPQREYPHDLSVHVLIRHEWWKRELRDKWPWSLMASHREEPSTERRAA